MSLAEAIDDTRPVNAESDLWVEFRDRYERCCVACRSRDADAFLAWAGPEGTFNREDGTFGRWEDTRPFWAWRFSQMLEVTRFDIDIESIGVDDDGLVVVDFHEVSKITVRNFEGDPAVRLADLHNRNWWRRSEAGLSIVKGSEPQTRRTLDGIPIEDSEDPIGFARWGRISRGEEPEANGS